MSRKKLVAAAAAVLIIAAVAFIGASAPAALVLRDADTGEVYAMYPVRDGDEFSVTFNHSVNKTDETELYRVQGRSIYLTGCIYYSFGAGVAEVLDEGWTLSYGESGEMIISDIDRKLESLRYVVGTVSDHILRIGEEEISLRGLCGKNSSVSFGVERRPAIARFRKE